MASPASGKYAQRSRIPACSFKPALHPEYEAIAAECEPWILALKAPASPAAAEFVRGCLFTYFVCLAFAPCIASRVAWLVKFYAWFFASDDDDDDLNVRGSAPDRMARRNELILCCFAGEALPAADDDGNGNITKGLPALQDIWKAMSKDMSLAMQSRFLKGVAEYLDANRVQAVYRKAGGLPSVEEYIKDVRRPASLAMPSLILMEYGLGIELDEETLSNKLLLELHETVVDHLGLFNDVFSFQSETLCGDSFNLPSIVFHERRATQPGFAFADAAEEAVSMVEAIDKRSAQLMEEVEKSSLIQKEGVRAYLRGLACWMGGNVEWSLKTARYSHTCSSEGIVTPNSSDSPAPILTEPGYSTHLLHLSSSAS